jgi:hypothetical protein
MKDNEVTMTLAEARKEAATGPLRVLGMAYSSGPPHLIENELLAIAQCYSLSDAVLLAHCYNHFDEVVKALESMLEEWRDRDGRRNSGNWRRCAAILANAKEVKT